MINGDKEKYYKNKNSIVIEINFGQLDNVTFGKAKMVNTILINTVIFQKMPINNIGIIFINFFIELCDFPSNKI